jgi:hypothetical protein
MKEEGMAGLEQVQGRAQVQVQVQVLAMAMAMEQVSGQPLRRRRRSPSFHRTR